MVYTNSDSESALLLPPTTGTTAANPIKPTNVPEDKFHLAYIIYFILGLGYLLPWNVFVTAVDYFAYLYPEANVDRIFAVAYMVVGFICILLIVLYNHKSNNFVRINVGLGLFVVSLLIVPLLDVLYIKGRVGLYEGFYVSVFAVALSGVADGLVQGGVIGSAGEMPERYMQSVVAGTAASGINFTAQNIFSFSVSGLGFLLIKV